MILPLFPVGNMNCSLEAWRDALLVVDRTRSTHRTVAGSTWEPMANRISYWSDHFSQRTYNYGIFAMLEWDYVLSQWRHYPV